MDWNDWPHDAGSVPGIPNTTHIRDLHDKIDGFLKLLDWPTGFTAFGDAPTKVPQNEQLQGITRYRNFLNKFAGGNLTSDASADKRYWIYQRAIQNTVSTAGGLTQISVKVRFGINLLNSNLRITYIGLDGGNRKYRIAHGDTTLGDTFENVAFHSQGNATLVITIASGSPVLNEYQEHHCNYSVDVVNNNEEEPECPAWALTPNITSEHELRIPEDYAGKEIVSIAQFQHDTRTAWTINLTGRDIIAITRELDSYEPEEGTRPVSTTKLKVFCPGHGLNVGDSIGIIETKDTMYDGAFQVADVIDGDHFTILAEWLGMSVGGKIQSAEDGYYGELFLNIIAVEGTSIYLDADYSIADTLKHYDFITISGLPDIVNQFHTDGATYSVDTEVKTINGLLKKYIKITVNSVTESVNYHEVSGLGSLKVYDWATGMMPYNGYTSGSMRGAIIPCINSDGFILSPFNLGAYPSVGDKITITVSETPTYMPWLPVLQYQLHGMLCGRTHDRSSYTANFAVGGPTIASQPTHYQARWLRDVSQPISWLHIDQFRLFLLLYTKWFIKYTGRCQRHSYGGGNATWYYAGTMQQNIDACENIPHWNEQVPVQTPLTARSAAVEYYYSSWRYKSLWRKGKCFLLFNDVGMIKNLWWTYETDSYDVYPNPAGSGLDCQIEFNGTVIGTWNNLSNYYGGATHDLTSIAAGSATNLEIDVNFSDPSFFGTLPRTPPAWYPQIILVEAWASIIHTFFMARHSFNGLGWWTES